MTAILRTALLAALVAASIPAVAAGQDTSTASLLRRIELLEGANADLERLPLSGSPLLRRGRVQMRHRGLVSRRAVGSPLRIGSSYEPLGRLHPNCAEFEHAELELGSGRRGPHVAPVSHLFESRHRCRWRPDRG